MSEEPKSPHVPGAGQRRWQRRWPGVPAIRPGTVAVALALIAAGFLFTTSAQTARGTQLRPDTSDLAQLVQSESARNEQRAARLARLRAENDQETAQEAAGNAALGALERRSAGLGMAAGVTAVRGPGLVVTLDDAPRNLPVPAQAGPDDLVVHQQDVQAVVNALWAGGAEAMMLQDQRVISTSAVRCVGNTLILQGRVYSPPYTVTAIGDVAGMRRALDASPQIAVYLQYVAALRLGWTVHERRDLTLPAYDGPLELRHAAPPATPAPSPSLTRSPNPSSSSRPSPTPNPSKGTP